MPQNFFERFPNTICHIGTDDPLLDDNIWFFYILNMYQKENKSKIFVYEKLIHCMLTIANHKWIDS